MVILVGVRTQPGGSRLSFFCVEDDVDRRVVASKVVDAKAAPVEYFGLLANTHHARLAKREKVG